MNKQYKRIIAVVSVIGFLIAACLMPQLQSALLAILTPRSAVAAPNVNNPTEWNKIFSDEFDGDTLDRSKWATCYEWFDAQYTGCTNNGNDELQWYLPEQAAVQGGHAILTAEKTPTTGSGQKYYDYRSGMLSSGRDTTGGPVKFEARYGYFEARIKVEGGKGVWPAFWLLPSDGSWPPEIDIMEFLGRKNNEVLLTYQRGTSNADHKEDSTTITGPDFTNGWHTYAVNWQPGRIEWFVDGVLKKNVSDVTVPNKSMYLILNLAVGGRLPGSPDASTPFPRTMQIDYVRAYGMVL